MIDDRDIWWVDLSNQYGASLLFVQTPSRVLLTIEGKRNRDDREIILDLEEIKALQPLIEAATRAASVHVSATSDATEPVTATIKSSDPSPQPEKREGPSVWSVEYETGEWPQLICNYPNGVEKVVHVENAILRLNELEALAAQPEGDERLKAAELQERLEALEHASRQIAKGPYNKAEWPELNTEAVHEAAKEMLDKLASALGSGEGDGVSHE